MTVLDVTHARSCGSTVGDIKAATRMESSGSSFLLNLSSPSERLSNAERKRKHQLQHEADKKALASVERRRPAAKSMTGASFNSVSEATFDREKLGTEASRGMFCLMWMLR